MRSKNAIRLVTSSVFLPLPKECLPTRLDATKGSCYPSVRDCSPDSHLPTKCTHCEFPKFDLSLMSESKAGAAITAFTATPNPCAVLSM